jgi:hypothetical protein
MLSTPTTFVIGAGASCDFNFPTGDGLQGRIAELLVTDGSPGYGQKIVNDRIWDAFQTIFLDAGTSWSTRAANLSRAADSIRKGMPVAASIDNFLHTHQDDPDVILVGKLAIAAAILDAEAASPLAVPKSSHRPLKADPLENAKFAGSWYSSFVKMLTMGTRSSEPEALFGNARFIVFNYDRCFELVMLRALVNYYGIGEQDAADILSTVDIIHPYGSLGPLARTENYQVPFGYQSADLMRIAEGLKTFTESIDTHVVDRARKAIGEAHTLVFLGFGFLPQNMELLTPDLSERGAHRIHATTYGISSSDKVVIANQLERFVSPNTNFLNMQYAARSQDDGFIDVENGLCSDLIGNHRMRLMQELL